jgi:type 2 lantibiotic biosynthesis protein LanM
LEEAERLSLPPSSGEREHEDLLADWRRRTGLVDDALFAVRLAADGLDERGLSALVRDWQAASDHQLDSDHRLDSDSGESHTVPASRADARTPAPWDDWGKDEGAIAPLLVLVEPALEAAESAIWKQLLETDASVPGVLETQSLYASASASIRRAALALISRAAIVELNRADADGHLGDGGSDERFRRFTREYGTGQGRQALRERYPLLGQQLAQRLAQTRAAWLEVLTRFVGDRDLMTPLLPAGAAKPVLARIELGRGDRHDNGRTVAILGLTDGQRVVYKPRSMAIEVAYFGFVDWLNRIGLDPAQRLVGVLDRGHYGYMEFIPALPVTDVADASLYYRRLGAVIALMHLFSGTDLHHENIIAHGAYPVPVDLETLLHPILPSQFNDDGARRMSADTVLWSQLLPTGGSKSGGWAGQAGLCQQATTATGQAPVNAGTSQLRYQKGEVAVEPSHNLPVHDGAAVPPWQHVDAIITGFRATYDLLCRHKAALLDSEGALAAFRGVTCRVVLRGTQVYATLLNAASHPSSLTARIEVEQLFERLWLAVAHTPRLAAVVAAERRALWRGDVPRFHVRSDERVVRDCSGAPLSTYFRRSGWQGLRRRIRTLSVRDRERQVRLIEQSVGSLCPVERMAGWSRTPYGPASPATAWPRDEFVATAISLAERVMIHRFRDGGDVRLLQSRLTAEGYTGMSPLGPDLYDGLPGIALFFAQLAEHTDSMRYRRFAEQLMDTARNTIKVEGMPAIGAFNGVAGWMYALAHLAQLWQEPALLEEAIAAVPSLLPAVGEDQSLDLIGGSAGALWCLLRLHQRSGDHRLLEAAKVCADRVVACAQPMSTGIAWLTSAYEDVAVTGLSHGASGFAVPLAWLAEATGDRRYDEAARAALAYERTTFDADAGAWNDLRDDRRTEDGAQAQLHAWCHGGPGITMARLCLPPAYRDAQWQVEVDAGLRGILAHGLGAGHCLCHGDLGNLDVLIEAERQGVGPADLSDWRHAAGQVLERVRVHPRCGTHQRIELLGLMTGLAGIGYGLLRCAEPRAVPSVLALQLPDSAPNPAP